jgi:hypothetical protein
MSDYVHRGYKIILQPVMKDGPAVMIDCVEDRSPKITYAGTSITVSGETPLASHIIAKIAELGGDLAKQYPDYDPDPKEI